MQLDQDLLSNPIRSYLYVVAILLGTFIFKRFISRFFASLIYTWVDKKNHSELRKSHVHRLVVPIEQFLLFLVAVIALYELKFPVLWDVHLFKVSLQQAIDSIVKLLFIILLIRVFIRTLEFVSIILEEKSKLTKSLSDDQLVLFFRDFFKVILYIIGALLILRYVFNENIGNLVTSLSIVGAAVALSMRESLENIISSFIIFFDKPFSIGDLVKVNNFTGTIEKIGLRSTRIRTQDKTYITVPNKQMVDTIVDNISLRTQRKTDLQLELSLSASAGTLQTLLTAMRSYLSTQKIDSFQVHLHDTGKQAHIVMVEYFSSAADEHEAYLMLREKINMALIEILEAHKIELAASSTDVVVKQL